MRVTRRQYAQAFNLGAPLDAELKPIAPKRTHDPAAAKEWHLQRDCISAIRARQKYDKDLAFMAPGAAQNNLKPAQRGFAKLMGWQAGLADIWLMRRYPHGLQPASLKWAVVELKLPRKPLSDEQAAWFKWLESAGIPCYRIDELGAFLAVLDKF